MTNSPRGTDTSAFITFAIMDELIRTLVGSGVLTKAQVAGILDRTAATVGALRRPQVAESLAAIHEMANEYRQ